MAKADEKFASLIRRHVHFFFSFHVRNKNNAKKLKGKRDEEDRGSLSVVSGSTDQKDMG